ncbi:hypothetical protein HMI55_004038, partial [Coelomomyces lativittatus]
EIGMSGYSDYEIPLDYSIVITSSSFKRIKKLGDLHQRILRIVFSIDTNSLVPLLWCVSFKINIPEINRNTEFISSFDRLTVPIDDRESSFFAFTILSYVKELTIDKGTYIGEVFTRSDGNMRSFAITTPSVVSINALLNSLNLPEAPNQQQSVIPESSGPQGTITSSESGPQGPTTSTKSNSNKSLTSVDKNQCKLKFFISSKCVTVKSDDKTQIEDEKCVPSKSKCDEEAIQSMKKEVRGEKGGKTQTTVKEVKKEEEKNIVSDPSQQEEEEQKNSAFTSSVSLVSILFFPLLLCSV